MARVTKKIKLDNVYGSYVKIVEPGSKFDGNGFEYSMQVVIPKDHPQLDELKKTITEILKEAFPKLSAGQKAGLKKGLRDNDEEGRAEDFPYLANTMFINSKRAESFGPVPVFDKAARPIEPTHETLYSGCKVNVILSIFSFDTNASKGISCGLEGIQIVDNTLERWDGRANPGSMFAALPGAEADSGFSAVSDDAPDSQNEDDDIPW